MIVMISFIIPAKNECQYIEGCLDSILEQVTEKEYEILVVDNNSTDNIQAVVKRKYASVKVIFESQAGTAVARQAGFKQALGEIVVFLDADVRLPHKHWLENFLSIMRQPNVVAVSTHYRYYELNWFLRFWQQLGTYICIYPWLFLIDRVFKQTSHMVGGMMGIKSEVLNRLGGFGNDTRFYGDEISIVKKLYPLGRIVVSPGLWVYTSGRRYNKFGMVNTVFKYVINYFVLWLTGKPYHKY